MDKPKKSKPQLNHNKKSKLSFLSVLKSLRPSLITGAADNDPYAITNYSQAGAKFGIVTGSGLTSVICKNTQR